MEIISLSATEMPVIVESLLESFKNYFVKMPTDIEYWKTRFYHARVDLSLSYGVQDEGKLVAFIINAIDTSREHKVAYNTGTGVIETHRGNQLVDKMYDYSLPLLKQAGITQCKLEVVDINERAIKVYKRIGFEKTRRLKSYKGNIKAGAPVKIKSLNLDKIESMNSYEDYAWDFTNTTVLKAKKYYQLYQVLADNNNAIIGHFVINTKNGTVAQLECLDENWEALFSGIAWASGTIKINNVDDLRIGLIEYLDKISMPNVIDQFEMEMII